MHMLTMFADYRVPVVLRQLGILRYSAHLASLVDGKQELQAGSEEEVELRGTTIQAVECLREALTALQPEFTTEDKPNSVLLDWCLWEIGEAARKTSPPHHRTRTIFY
jgi:Potential Queuosine, Q, salvage protein family